MADPQWLPPSMPPLGQSIPLVPPLYQSSVYTLPDLDALDQIMDAERPGFTYARDGHPNGRFLAEQLTRLERAAWAIICGSGMAAISAPLLALLQSGDRIVASNSLYGRTTQLFLQQFPRFGMETTFVDVRELRHVKSVLDTPTKVLFVETLSNPLLALADIAALAEIAHERGCLLAVDNTFATPVLTRPLELGVDLVVESLTKMIGGHGDVTLGLVCGVGQHLPQVSQVVSIWGLSANPFDCWLASRGLSTLAVRMRAASANAAALADWLAEQRGVTRVIYPGRPDHPDHELAQRQLVGGFGNMLSFELEDGRDAVNRFMRRARSIPFSPSLGATTTTCSHPATTSHRYTSPAEKRRLGITEGLIRLSVGVEEFAYIQKEMARGL
jgi:cystathionine beta-lyase/cystathionine gamma-synthase